MPYCARITRHNPSCFVFLVDQSGSMIETFPGGTTKADAVATAINTCLDAVVDNCTQGDDVLNYFHVGVIGYGQKVRSALSGPLAKCSLITAQQLAEHPLRIEERKKPVLGFPDEFDTIAFRTWLDSVADGMTPMCQALDLGYQWLREFIAFHPDCFPPVVLNITDGVVTDGDPVEVAHNIHNLASNDGHVLLFNLHISSATANPIEFPSNDKQLPHDYSRLLFRMSSTLPPSMKRLAQRLFPTLSFTPSSRGFIFNGRADSIVNFLEIGTLSSFDQLKAQPGAE
jgi:uncharacterized protein YegL